MSHYNEQRDRHMRSVFGESEMVDSAITTAERVALGVCPPSTWVYAGETNDYAFRSSPLPPNSPTIPEEMNDWMQVMFLGAYKHGKDNWLEPDGRKSSLKEMHDSMFHHLAESFAGGIEDKDTKLHPLLHLATRALMCYTRQKRGIKHKND